MAKDAKARIDVHELPSIYPTNGEYLISHSVRCESLHDNFPDLISCQNAIDPQILFLLCAERFWYIHICQDQRLLDLCDNSINTTHPSPGSLLLFSRVSPQEWAAGPIWITV